MVLQSRLLLQIFYKIGKRKGPTFVGPSSSVGREISSLSGLCSVLLPLPEAGDVHRTAATTTVSVQPCLALASDVRLLEVGVDLNGDFEDVEEAMNQTLVALPDRTSVSGRVELSFEDFEPALMLKLHFVHPIFTHASRDQKVANAHLDCLHVELALFWGRSASSAIAEGDPPHRIQKIEPFTKRTGFGLLEFSANRNLLLRSS